ncbi:MAG: hypothetical protein KAU14_10020 [Thermoplasmata archaeon]|nr:hypothetical protein [Thermoplasmata archaeon]
MPKDERTTSYIEEFNRSHRRIKREEKDWYVPYLPRGLGMEDITEKEDKDLMGIFTEVEAEIEKRFDGMVKERFIGYLESLSLSDMIEYLPQKPAPVLLEELSSEDRNTLKEIYYTGIESGYIKKTIRKQIRRYLKGKGYLKGKKKVADKKIKKGPKKEEKRPAKKRVEESRIAMYLPKKPVPISLRDLKEKDREIVEELCRTGIEAGYVKKTIRKQVRRFLVEKGYPTGSEKETNAAGKEEEKKKKEIEMYLPQKPAPISLKDLKEKDREIVEELFRSGIEAGYVKKTIRRQIRRYLLENGCL